MTKREHVQLWHKRQGKETGVNALAVRGTIRDAKPVGKTAKLTPAQAFLKNLKIEIKKAV